MKIMPTLLSVALLASPAYAAKKPTPDFRASVKLWEQACAEPKSIKDNNALARYAVCREWTIGFTDAVNFYSKVVGDRRFCIPDDVTTDEIVMDVKQFLTDHPDGNGQPMVAILLATLKVTWPCHEGGDR